MPTYSYHRTTVTINRFFRGVHIRMTSPIIMKLGVGLGGEECWINLN